MSASLETKAPQNTKILVVEDRPIDRDYLRTVLGYGGYQVMEAGDGAAALDLVRRERPDLVITDLMMPALDGYALVRAIRAEAAIATTRVMFCTATDRSQETNLLASALGAMSVLTKPVEPETLLAEVGVVLGSAQAPQGFVASPEEIERSHLRLLNDALVEKSARLEHEIAQRANAERELAQSRRRIANIIETAMDAIISVDSEQRIMLFNKAAEKMFGLLQADAIGQPLDRLLPERHRAAHRKHVRDFAKTGHSGREMGRLSALSARRTDGSEFPVEASIAQATVEGQTLLTVILRDITERKKHDDHVQLLLREVNHRAKNMLAVVQAITALTAVSTPQDFIPRFSERIQALAANQDLLIESQWQGVSMEDLVVAQLAHFKEILGSRITLAGEPLRINAEAAQVLAMTFHELATNASKYGALSNSAGRIAIEWRVEHEGAGSQFHVSWIESGGPEVSAPVLSGFGATVIVHVPKLQLDASVQLNFPATGAIWRFTCPAGRVLECNG